MTKTRAPAGRWVTLPVVCAAQLLVVLDGTIVNIALPSAQQALDMPDASRHWVITAYLLAFGGLLLPGGRISGALGHRRGFIIGLSGFAVASAMGGAADTAGLLIAARALQGVFAALLAPAGLSLLTMTFTEPAERGRAFGAFAAVGAGGSAVGLIAGGLLTELTSWRWCLYINVPIALLAGLGALLIRRDTPSRGGGFDVPGAVLSVAGFTALGYAFSQTEARGWTDPVVVGGIAGGVVALAGFILVERRTARPLLPLGVLWHRARGSAIISIGLTHVAMFGFFLFMSYYTQTVLGYSPIQAGLTLIINALAAVVGSVLIAGRLQGRVRPSMVVVPGLVAMAVGVYIVTGLSAQSTGVLPVFLTPALLLTGLGLGAVIATTASQATQGVRGHETGIAAAGYNAAMQLGAALGTALFNSIATAATESSSDTGNAAIVNGYTSALTVAFGILVAAALVAAVLEVSRSKASQPNSSKPIPERNPS